MPDYSRSENGYVGSFNGGLRDELPKRHLLGTPLEAAVLMKRSPQDYSTVPPSVSLGYQPPAPRPSNGLNGQQAPRTLSLLAPLRLPAAIGLLAGLTQKVVWFPVAGRVSPGLLRKVCLHRAMTTISATHSAGRFQVEHEATLRIQSPNEDLCGWLGIGRRVCRILISNQTRNLRCVT